MSNKNSQRKVVDTRNTTAARKKSNRGSCHNLNVRVNSKKSKRLRRRIVFIKAFKWTAAVGIVLVVLGGVYRGVDSFLFESSKFLLREISYETDGNLSKGRVIKHAGVGLGENILRVNLKQARHQILSGLPKVREVKIIRDLPGHLTFRVRERTPVAWLNEPKSLGQQQKMSEGLLLDKLGVPFLCEEPASRFKSLPVIFSDQFSQLSPGQRVQSLPVLRGLSLMSAFSSAFKGSPVRLESLREASDYSLVGDLNTGSKITFGLDEIDRQVGDLKLLLAEATRRGRVIAAANVMVKKNTPVKFTTTFSADLPVLRALPVTAPHTPRALPVSGSKQVKNSSKDPKKVLRSLPPDPN